MLIDEPIIHHHCIGEFRYADDSVGRMTPERGIFTLIIFGPAGYDATGRHARRDFSSKLIYMMKLFAPKPFKTDQGSSLIRCG
jgi:hypothetical protein